MGVSEARRLKVLEDENTKLKKLLAEAMLDNGACRKLFRRLQDRPDRPRF
jgi:putative transposase